MAVRGCMGDSPVREQINPNVSVKRCEKRIRFTSQSVTVIPSEQAVASEEIKDRVATCFGKIKNMLTLLCNELEKNVKENLLDSEKLIDAVLAESFAN